MLENFNGGLFQTCENCLGSKWRRKSSKL